VACARALCSAFFGVLGAGLVKKWLIHPALSGCRSRINFVRFVA